MADFAPNWTPRYRIQYQTRGFKHRMQFRFVRGTVDSGFGEIQGAVKAFLDVLAPLRWNDWTVLGADFAATDSDVFLPVAPPSPVAGTSNPFGTPGAYAAIQTGFIGKTDAGGRNRIFVYGLNLPPVDNAAADFRVLSSEKPVIADAIVALRTFGTPLVGGDGFDSNWYDYVNVKFNDYWVRRLRG